MYKNFYVINLLLLMVASRCYGAAPEGSSKQALSTSQLQLIKAGSKGAMAAFTGYLGGQCLMSAALMNPSQYQRTLNVVENSLQVLQSNPKIIQALVWFFEREKLSPEDLNKSIAIINECKLHVDSCKPLAYMATGAFAAISAYFAYNFIQNSRELHSLWTTSRAEQLQGDLPEHALVPIQPSIVQTASYAALAGGAGLSLNALCKSSLWNVEVIDELLDISLSVLEKAQKETAFADMLGNALGQPLNLQNLLGEYVGGLTEVVRPAVKAIKPGLYVAGGMLSLIALYTTYKAVVGGYALAKQKITGPQNR